MSALGKIMRQPKTTREDKEILVLYGQGGRGMAGRKDVYYEVPKAPLITYMLYRLRKPNLNQSIHRNIQPG